MTNATNDWVTSGSVHDEINRYIQRMPGARKAMLRDPQYHRQIQWIERMLELLNMALEDEGVPEDARLRVMRTVLYGAADESEATHRINQTKRLIDEAARRSTFVAVDAQTRPMIL